MLGIMHMDGIPCYITYYLGPGERPLSVYTRVHSE